MVLWLSLFPARVQAPNFYQNEFVLVEENTLKGNNPIIWGVESLIWEAADKYQIDYDFFKAVINCECNLKKDHEKCLGDKGLAFGRAQFHKSTFEANCVGDYRSEKDQVFCAAEMISEDKGYHWSCFKKQVSADLK